MGYKEPHRHAEIIKAWADGAEIEFRYEGSYWATTKNPTWRACFEYRVKPVLIHGVECVPCKKGDFYIQIKTGAILGAPSNDVGFWFKNIHEVEAIFKQIVAPFKAPTPIVGEA